MRRTTVTSPARPPRRSVPPLAAAVLLAGFAATSVLVASASASVKADRRGAFERRSAELRDGIVKDVAAASEVLFAMRGLYSVDPNATRGDFRRFVQESKARDRTPGLRALGHATAIQRSEVSAFEDRVRGDESVPEEDRVGFEVKTMGSDPSLVVTDAVQPLATNEASLGLDLMSRADRRAAVVGARDSGELVGTEPIELVAAPELPGFLLLVATYDAPTLPTTEPARRRHFSGVVSAVFRVDRLLDEVLGGATDLDVEIYDVGSTIDPASKDLERSSLLFNASGELNASSPPGRHPSGLYDLNVGGRRWRVYVAATDNFPGATPVLPFAVGVGGSAASILGAALVTVIGRSRHNRRQAAFQSFVEFAPDAIVMINAEGRIVQVNVRCEEMFAYDRSDLIGHPVEVLLPPDLRNHHVSHRLGFVQSPRARAMGADRALLGIRSDQTVFPVDVSLSPITTEDGTLYAAAVRDITERRQAELARQLASEQLREADRLKDEFLDITAHELRTPLTAIDGFTEVLRTDEAHLDSEQRSRLVGRIAANALEMREMVERLLDLSQLNAGRIDLHPTRLELRKAVEHFAERAAHRLQGHPLVIDIDPSVRITMDRAALRHIMVNLLTNAAKFSDVDTPITVRSIVRDDVVEIQVEDRGPGIPEADQKRLFERFFQGANQRPGVRGTGVGLTIVQRYAELSGGQVGVRTAVGKGSTFWFTVPNAPDAEETTKS
ncbi:MAG: CHASE domain-containing protein [Acidimicrobiales bacterium]